MLNLAALFREYMRRVPESKGEGRPGIVSQSKGSAHVVCMCGQEVNLSSGEIRLCRGCRRTFYAGASVYVVPPPDPGDVFVCDGECYREIRYAEATWLDFPDGRSWIVCRDCLPGLGLEGPPEPDGNAESASEGPGRPEPHS